MAGPSALQRRIDIKAAVLNHYTFICDICDCGTGQDLYPEFRRHLASMPTDHDLLTVHAPHLPRSVAAGAGRRHAG